MAITIRNKETEAMIRELGRRWGLGPSGVVRKLAKDKIGEAGRVSQEEFQRRMAAWDEIMKLAPPRDPNLSWEDVEREMDSLLDDMKEGGAGLQERQAS